MNNIIKLSRKIMPEMSDILEKRYSILRNIYYSNPIGRRTLSNKIGISERIVRKEIGILKEQNLIEVNSAGMNITEEGRMVVEEFKDFIHMLKGLKYLENTLESKLNIKKVFIVPGDYIIDESVFRDVGKTASGYIRNIVSDGSIIGVTGGTTMAQVAEEMPSVKTKKDILVLPARGGMGKNVETQANYIAAKMANRLGGSYKLLHVPDNVNKEALKTLLDISEIKELINIIKNIDVLVFGLGRADVMAERRGLSDKDKEKLLSNGAVAEAFGYYFNKNGQIVMESSTVGLSLKDFLDIDDVIGVACGEKKAEAIMSICSIRDDITIIIDEGAAKKIESLLI